MQTRSVLPRTRFLMQRPDISCSAVHRSELQFGSMTVFYVNDALFSKLLQCKQTTALLICCRFSLKDAFTQNATNEEVVVLTLKVWHCVVTRESDKRSALRHCGTWKDRPHLPRHHFLIVHPPSKLNYFNSSDERHDLSRIVRQALRPTLDAMKRDETSSHVFPMTLLSHDKLLSHSVWT